MAAEGPVITGRLLTFRVGPGRFAVPLEDVLGIQDPVAAGTVAGGGVFFQGQPVATVDARALWSNRPGRPEATGPAAAIVVKGGGGATALLVDRVEAIVEGVEMRPLPGLVAAFVKTVFRGVTLDGEGGRLVIDTAALPGSAAGGGAGGPGEA